jgi:guanyl-specific ribonuclease Sa
MKIIVALVAAAGLSACDTSALQDIQDTAAQAQATVETVNARSAQVQAAIENPGGALLAAVGATFSRTATDQAGLHVLTDLQTGCQFLATYGPDGTTVGSIAPRVEAAPEGGTRQRCVAIPGVSSGPEAEG